jgi:hypothetical protein
MNVDKAALKFFTANHFQSETNKKSNVLTFTESFIVGMGGDQGKKITEYIRKTVHVFWVV